jgi:hypothetical protein
LEWREISAAELSEIKNEKARFKKTKKARFIGGVARHLAHGELA